MPETQTIGMQPDEAYRFSAKATDGRQVEQTLTAPSLEAAILESWDVIQQHQRNGIPIQSARIDWTDAEGPQISYIYDRQQGFELSKPGGVDLQNNPATSQLLAMEDAIRQHTQPAAGAPLSTDEHQGHSRTTHPHEEQQQQHNSLGFGY